MEPWRSIDLAGNRIQRGTYYLEKQDYDCNQQPYVDSKYDTGSPTKQWENVYARNLWRNGVQVATLEDITTETPLVINTSGHISLSTDATLKVANNELSVDWTVLPTLTPIEKNNGVVELSHDNTLLVTTNGLGVDWSELPLNTPFSYQNGLQLDLTEPLFVDDTGKVDIYLGDHGLHTVVQDTITYLGAKVDDWSLKVADEDQIFGLDLTIPKGAMYVDGNVLCVGGSGISTQEDPIISHAVRLNIKLASNSSLTCDSTGLYIPNPGSTKIPFFTTTGLAADPDFTWTTGTSKLSAANVTATGLIESNTMKVTTAPAASTDVVNKSYLDNYITASNGIIKTSGPTGVTLTGDYAAGRGLLLTGQTFSWDATGGAGINISTANVISVDYDTAYFQLDGTTQQLQWKITQAFPIAINNNQVSLLYDQDLFSVLQDGTHELTLKYDPTYFKKDATLGLQLNWTQAYPIALNNNQISLLYDQTVFSILQDGTHELTLTYDTNQFTSANNKLQIKTPTHLIPFGDSAGLMTSSSSFYYDPGTSTLTVPDVSSSGIISGANVRVTNSPSVGTDCVNLDSLATHVAAGSHMTKSVSGGVVTLACSLTAGTGLSLSGDTLAVNLSANNGVSISGNTISGAYTGSNGVSVSGSSISGNYVGGSNIHINGNTISFSGYNNTNPDTGGTANAAVQDALSAVIAAGAGVVGGAAGAAVLGGIFDGLGSLVSGLGGGAIAMIGAGAGAIAGLGSGALTGYLTGSAAGQNSTNKLSNDGLALGKPGRTDFIVSVDATGDALAVYTKEDWSHPNTYEMINAKYMLEGCNIGHSFSGVQGLGTALNVNTLTFSDDVTSAFGTSNEFALVKMSQPTIDWIAPPAIYFTTPSVATPRGSTLYIEGPPLSTTANHLDTSNSYSLYIASGQSNIPQITNQCTFSSGLISLSHVTVPYGDVALRVNENWVEDSILKTSWTPSTGDIVYFGVPGGYGGTGSSNATTQASLDYLGNFNTRGNISQNGAPVATESYVSSSIASVPSLTFSNPLLRTGNAVSLLKDATLVVNTTTGTLGVDTSTIASQSWVTSLNYATQSYVTSSIAAIPSLTFTQPLVKDTSNAVSLNYASTLAVNGSNQLCVNPTLTLSSLTAGFINTNGTLTLNDTQDNAFFGSELTFFKSKNGGAVSSGEIGFVDFRALDTSLNSQRAALIIGTCTGSGNGFVGGALNFYIQPPSSASSVSALSLDSTGAYSLGNKLATETFVTSQNYASAFTVNAPLNKVSDVISVSTDATLSVTGSKLCVNPTLSLTSLTTSSGITATGFSYLNGGADVQGGDLRTYRTDTGGVYNVTQNQSNANTAFTINHIKNDTGNGLALFINSSTRPDDGGASNATIRNDCGSLLLQDYSGHGAVISGGGNISCFNDVSIGGNLTVTGSISGVNTGSFTFSSGSVASPSFTTVSAGERICLSSQISSSSADYAIGLSTNSMWFGTPTLNNSHRFYCGQTDVMDLNGSTGLSLNFVPLNTCLVSSPIFNPHMKLCYSNGSQRIAFGLLGSESGSNAGSDLYIKTYADDGVTTASTAMWITRSNGTVNIPTLSSATTTVTDLYCTSVRSGAWESTTPVAVGYGGTGVTSVPSGQIVYGNNTNALTSNSSFYYSASSLYAPNIGTSRLYKMFDNRAAKPADFPAATCAFGFGSWTNDSNGPFCDSLALNLYADGTGGDTNFVLFKKTGIGMRIYQQTFNSSSNFSTYNDVVMSDSTGAITGPSNLGTGFTSWTPTITKGSVTFSGVTTTAKYIQIFPKVFQVWFSWTYTSCSASDTTNDLTVTIPVSAADSSMFFLGTNGQSGSTQMKVLLTAGSATATVKWIVDNTLVAYQTRVNGDMVCFSGMYVTQ